MTPEEILELFKKTGALLEGHFRLTSGLHSPQYFQCAKVLQYPEYAEAVCRLIAERFSSVPIDVVIAPALGGIVVGQEVGRQISRKTSKSGFRIVFTERKEKAMLLRRGFEISPGESVLVCEDVITTGGSVSEVIKIVEEKGASVAGVGAIVDRSGGKVTFDGKLFATIALNVTSYPPENCPLCKQNIPLYAPGSRPVAAGH
ncbi:MAG TPA: orotate phosphoribosyltransferase [Bacteroidota bacterium]|nr:orotate phosphoribosyltransferase [Bacteroidota bacterium]